MGKKYFCLVKMFVMDLKERKKTDYKKKKKKSSAIQGTIINNSKIKGKL